MELQIEIAEHPTGITTIYSREGGVSDTIFFFELTPAHVKALRRLVVNQKTKINDGCTIPVINGYRPYGNSDVLLDIADFTDTPFPKDPLPDDETIKRLQGFSAQIPTALSVVLQTGSFEPGLYTKSGHGQFWQRTTDPLEFILWGYAKNHGALVMLAETLEKSNGSEKRL